MNGIKNFGTSLKPIGLALGLGWTLLIGVSLWWNLSQVQHELLETAYIQAKVASEKDLLYRQWNANHGGVYVPETDMTPSNPYLKGITEKEVTTPSGVILTLMNPAYMTRQVAELEAGISDVRSHLSSLKPIRPGNSPDAWERQALEAFESGQGEVAGEDTIDGRLYYRIMRPFLTEKGCLKCHAWQGYKENDIRGGISVSIPMSPLQGVASRASARITMIHILIWIIVAAGILVGYFRLVRSERERDRVEEDLKKAYTSVEEKITQRTQELEKEIEEKKLAENKTRKQLEELRTWQSLIIDREQRNIELKKEVNGLLSKLGHPKKYG